LHGFCQFLPGDDNVSQLNELQLSETMQTRYERAETSLADRHRTLTIYKDVKAVEQCLQETVGLLLERGEKIQNLAEKSGKLSQQSKEFYTNVGESEIKPSRRYW
jgi:hypothetical protein